MKNLKQLITIIAVAVFMINANNVFGQTGGCVVLPPPLGDIITNQIPINQLYPPGKSSVSLNSSEIVNYLSDFHNGILNSKTMKKTEYNSLINQLSSFRKVALKDPKVSLLMSLLEDSNSYLEFKSKYKKAKPTILSMNNGAIFYVKLDYTLQIIESIAHSGGNYNFPPIIQGKGGPNLVDKNVYFDGCWGTTAAWAIVGTAVAGPPWGTLIGGVVGYIGCEMGL